MRSSLRSAALAGLAAAVSVLAGACPSADAQQMDRVRVGVLECRGGASIGFVVGSVTHLGCVLRADGVPEDRYIATIRKVGVDLGITQEFDARLGGLCPGRASRDRRSLRQLCRRAGLGFRRRRGGRQCADRRLGQLDRATAAQRTGAGRPQRRRRPGKSGAASRSLMFVPLGVKIDLSPVDGGRSMVSCGAVSCVRNLLQRSEIFPACQSGR